jgi:F-type H+-transporting ATPase subunit delta
MRTAKKYVRAARHLYRFCLVDGVLDEKRVRLVAHRVARSKRRGALPILSNFYRLVRLDRERHTALVESAVPLAGPLEENIRAHLARRYGSALEASFTANPALIGGMRIKVGSTVFDGSVRGRLNALQVRL